MPDDGATWTDLWRDRWPACPPISYRLRGPYRDVWVRFHSLPESKRYPENEAEYAVVLDRYNTVLDELFAGEDVYVITSEWTAGPEPAPSPSRPGYWQSLLAEDDPDPELRTYLHLFVTRRAWQRGCIDDVLRDVADDAVGGVLITDTRMRRIHAPYDGGADVLLTTPEERARTLARHTDWLPGNPQGL